MAENNLETIKEILGSGVENIETLENGYYVTTKHVRSRFSQVSSLVDRMQAKEVIISPMPCKANCLSYKIVMK